MTEPQDLPPDNDLGPDQSQRVEQLASALDAFLEFRAEQDAADRADDFLDRHGALRELLEPMVAEASAAGSLDGSEAAIASGRAPDPGQLLGDYRILREIGRGGMGTVYEAEQVSLRRRVALKLLHEHLTSSPKSIARFRREAAAASRLQHPGIVPIYEVGEWRGRHYFTMEFLEGKPLHQAMLQPRLGVRADCSPAAEAAELVARVGDALQHAHDHGLVHRDVKPHNIMVGVDGSVRLLDFGLVKLDEPGVDSVTAEFLGTPFYCSPEQVLGKPIGPVSDVFSLGVVLYELLARQRPFIGNSTREILQRIESGDHPALARVAPSAPRDLRTICEKAMEHVPAARYATAGAMAADIRRFLRIEPILATPPSTIVRCGKWMRRHRSRVMLWAAGTLLLVGVPVGYAIHQHRTRVAVEAERERLDEAEKLAFRSIRETLVMLDDDLQRQPGPGSRKQPRVDAVVRLCEEFLSMGHESPVRRTQVAQAYRSIANINLHLGNPGGALTACHRALDLLDLAADRVDPRVSEPIRGRLLRLKMRARMQANPLTAAEDFEAATALWRAMAEKADCTTETIVEYAETLIVRATALGQITKRRQESHELLVRALELLTPERREELEHADWVAINATRLLANVEFQFGRIAKARELFEEVLAHAPRKLSPAVAAARIIARAGLGSCMVKLRDTVAAKDLLEQAIADGVRFAQEFPGASQLNRSVQRARVQLATLLLVERRYERAESLLRAAREAMTNESMAWHDRAMRADIDVLLANVLIVRTNGKSESNEPRELLHGVCAQLIRLLEEQPGQNTYRVELGAAWNNLASLANEQRDHASARDFANRAIVVQRRAVDLEPGNRRARGFLGLHHSQLAFALAHLGEADGAVKAAATAIELFPNQVGVMRLAAEAATVAAGISVDEEHAKTAVDALAQMARFHPDQARRWLGDGRFASLRERADFKELASRLDK
ncbi:MAG: serine/threonine protein kinase [bacterium]|nr:serine/threonine protein kinase [bacterium]